MGELACVKYKDKLFEQDQLPNICQSGPGSDVNGMQDWSKCSLEQFDTIRKFMFNSSLGLQETLITGRLPVYGSRMSRSAQASVPFALKCRIWKIIEEQRENCKYQPPFRACLVSSSVFFLKTDSAANLNQIDKDTECINVASPRDIKLVKDAISLARSILPSEYVKPVIIRQGGDWAPTVLDDALGSPKMFFPAVTSPS